jgi:hypothetical protein
MMNIESMRAMVKKMGPDPQGMARLREFARQNHDNAIAMSLVSSRLTDIQRAKQMDEAKKVPAEPNTVIDQVAQSIPVEESGIAGLPVQNMAMAANGGIVGYAGDGEQGQLVKSGGTPAERMLQGIRQSMDATNEAAELKNALAKKYGTASALPGMFIEQSDAERKNAKAIMGRLNSMSPTEMRFVLETGALPQGSSSFQAYERNRKGNAPSDIDTTAAQRQTDSKRLGVVEPAVVNREPARAAPAAQSAPAQPVSEPTTQGVLDQFKAFQDSIGSPTYAEIVTKQEAANALAKKAAEDSKAATENYYAKRGDAFKGKDERLAAREAALEKTKSSIEGMAWIQAGLETMATSGSLGQAIAAGGKKGMESYGSGIKNYTDSKERLDEARDKLDDLRTGYKDMSEKEIMAATRDINNVVTNSSQAMVTLLREQAKNGDQKAADLLKIYNDQQRLAQEAKLKQAEINQRERHYQNASTDTERLVQRVLDLQAQGKTKEADNLLKTFQDVKGIGQREDAVLARIEAKKQEKLASDPMYKRALRILADPNATPEAKTKAERDRLIGLQAAGLHSGTTMTPPPPDAVKLIQK